MPATDDDTLLPFSLPNICKKKVTAAFDGGQVSSDGGVFLLQAADKRLGLIDTLAGLPAFSTVFANSSSLRCEVPATSAFDIMSTRILFLTPNHCFLVNGKRLSCGFTPAKLCGAL